MIKTDYKEGEKVRVIRESNQGVNGHALHDNNADVKKGEVLTVVRRLDAGANTLSGRWMYTDKHPIFGICPSLVEPVEE